MRYFSVTQRAILHNQLVVNTFWYRQDAVGDADNLILNALLDAFHTEVWLVWDDIMSNQFVVTQRIAQGYRDNWTRAPFLPVIRDMSHAGASPATSGPPIQCAILSMRVEPEVPAPRLSPPAPSPTSPVRRGYLAISGIPDVEFQSTGFIRSTWLTDPAVTAFEATVVDGLAGNFTPIRVSEPLPNTDARGYGLIRQAKFSNLVSARRSRKVGRGA